MSKYLVHRPHVDRGLDTLCGDTFSEEDRVNRSERDALVSSGEYRMCPQCDEIFDKRLSER